MSMITPFRLISDNLLIQFRSPRRVLSSAVLGGGFRKASFIINHWIRKEVALNNEEYRVQLDQRPGEYLQNFVQSLSLKGPGVGLITAVNIPKKLVVLRENFGELWVEGFFTVGVGNSVRAGDPTVCGSEGKNHSVGTINIILLTNAGLSDSAMVEAVQVATESKTAVLLESGIRSSVSHKPATGTGTDSTAIVSGQGQSLRHSGTHTKIGELIGRAVSEGITKGLKMCRTIPRKSRKEPGG